LLGIAGGVIWYAGVLANFVAASAEQQAKVGPAVSYALGQGAVMISVLWGLLVWREFSGADFRVKNLLYVMMALFMLTVCGWFRWLAGRWNRVRNRRCGPLLRQRDR
jgi:glucose uptake protein